MKEKIIISLISKLTIQLISLVATYILILNLDVNLLGIWGVLSSISNLGFIFIDLGLSIIHFQYSEKEDFNDYFSSFFLIKLALIISNLFLSFTLVIFLDIWKTPYLYLIVILIFSNGLLELLNIFLIHLYAKSKVFKVEIPALIINICQILLKIYIAVNINQISNPLFWLSILNTPFLLFHLIIILVFFRNEFKFRRPKKSIIITYFKDSKVLIIDSILLLFAANFGNVLIASSFDNETLAYVYIVSTYIIPTLNIIAGSIITICIPVFTKYIKNGEKFLVEKTTHLIEKYISILYLSIIIFFYTLGDFLFSTFLPNYTHSIPILYILVVNSYILSITRIYIIILLSGKKQSLTALISIMQMILEIILMIIFIPRNFFGIKMLGLSSIGYCISVILPNLMICAIFFRYYANKLFNIKSQKEIIIHLILTFISLMTIFFFNNVIFKGSSNKTIFLGLILFLALSIFYGGLFSFRILKKEDIRMFRQLISLEEYKRSWITEFTEKEFDSN